jgi:hypothetical protein
MGGMAETRLLHIESTIKIFNQATSPACVAPDNYVSEFEGNTPHMLMG